MLIQSRSVYDSPPRSTHVCKTFAPFEDGLPVDTPEATEMGRLSGHHFALAVSSGRLREQFGCARTDKSSRLSITNTMHYLIWSPLKTPGSSAIIFSRNLALNLIPFSRRYDC